MRSKLIRALLKKDNTREKNYFVRKCLQIFLFLVLPIKGEYKKMGH